VAPRRELPGTFSTVGRARLSGMRFAFSITRPQARMVSGGASACRQGGLVSCASRRVRQLAAFLAPRDFADGFLCIWTVPGAKPVASTVAVAATARSAPAVQLQFVVQVLTEMGPSAAR